MAQRKKSTRRKVREIAKECFFCKEKRDPTFLEPEMLSRFTSERGKMFSRSKSGACGKHQRKLTNAIKRARYMAFLPFLVRPE